MQLFNNVPSWAIFFYIYCATIAVHMAMLPKYGMRIFNYVIKKDLDVNDNLYLWGLFFILTPVLNTVWLIAYGFCWYHWSYLPSKGVKFVERPVDKE